MAQGARARVARRFALAYAAGALACDYGILPWKRAAVLSAVKACHSRVMWPDVLVNQSTPEQSIAVVRTYIKRFQEDFVDLRRARTKLTKREIEVAPGIILARNQGKFEFVFWPSVFRERVCAGTDPHRAWDHLSAVGLLNQQKGGKRAITRDFPRPAGRLRVISVKPAILDGGGADPD